MSLLFNILSVFVLIHCLYLTSLVAQTVKHLPTLWETWVQSLGQEDLLKKEMATHSSILAWKIPLTEEPDRLQSMGSQRVGHNWATSLHICHSFPAKRQLSSNFMVTVTISSDFRTQEEESYHWFIFSPLICHEVKGPDTMILVFLILSSKLLCFFFPTLLFHIYQEAI